MDGLCPAQTRSTEEDCDMQLKALEKASKWTFCPPLLDYKFKQELIRD